MKNYFIIFTFILLLNCSFDESNKGIVNINMVQKGINEFEEDSFEEYTNLLSNKTKSKAYPDINNFPD